MDFHGPTVDVPGARERFRDHAVGNGPIAHALDELTEFIESLRQPDGHLVELTEGQRKMVKRFYGVSI